MRVRLGGTRAIAAAAILASLSCGSGGDGSQDVSPAELVGLWRRQDAGSTDNGKEYLSDGSGYLGNFIAGPFTRATPFTWTVSSPVIVEVWPAETHHEEVIAFDGATLTLRRAEDGLVRHFLRVQ